jgi:signal transduction histidine kinase
MTKKVLVVDDEEGIRRVLNLSLKVVGYEVLSAGRAQDALHLVRTEQPPIVLADIKMPGMDGIELLKRIKEERADTEVIMMTGHADMELAIKCLRFEAADFITKPINFDALEVALKRAQERISLKQQVRDYTESLERLVGEKTQQLLAAERLAAMGETVATIAHAVKNIVTGLKGGMYVLQKGIELEEKPYLHQGWDMIRGNMDKIKNLAMDLLRFSKDRRPDYDLCDPNIPAREVYHLMSSRAADDKVALRLDLSENLDRVYLDPEGIYCCLLNIVSNALDACIAKEGSDEIAEVVLRSRPAEGWAVEYEVTDNGSGMDEATRKQVFRSFFSTKGSKGTGLGLMVTEKIIREHGGTIELASEPGKGTSLRVRLPQRKDIFIDSSATCRIPLPNGDEDFLE